MFEDSKRRELVECKARSILLEVQLFLTAWFKVAVMLFVITRPSLLRADDVNGINFRLFEFTSEFYMPMGRGIFNGLMASDGSLHRIAIYWIEPDVYLDKTYFLGHSDFIFDGNFVHYWINGVSQPETFNLSDKESVPLLPREVSPQSVALSALAIVGRIKSESPNENTSLEIGRFFRQSRNKADYPYEVPPEQKTSDRAFVSRASDEQILNALPFGRKYSKHTQEDGTMVWRAQRIMDGPHVARVTVKPVSGKLTDDAGNIFDPNTLGQWTLVPEPYRIYWSFDRAYSKLKDVPVDSSGRELYDKIESYLSNNKIPPNLYPFFNQLWFETAILTDDITRVSISVQATVAELCNNASPSNYQGMLELARIANKIHVIYPQQAEELIRPLIGQMAKRAGHDASGNLDKLMKTIENKMWFWYGKLLVEELQNQALIENDTAIYLSSRLETFRLAEEKDTPDPCELTPTIKQYLAQLDSDPPAGALTMDDVCKILEKGLEKPCTDANLDSSRDHIVEDTIRSIRMIAVEGPFRGDQARLTESVKHFSDLYLTVFKYKEPLDTSLATFLALSFCDNSTPEDHDALFYQICRLITEFQTLTNNTLSEQGLSNLVEPNDVERVFSMYKNMFRMYINDPLMPALKFPLTNNEQTRLRNKLKLHFMQLDPFFKEMSLKLKFNGESKKLKEETIYKISLAAQQFLPKTAFLRNPPYPGVSNHYQDGYGFAALIDGPLYIEGNRPKEKFKVMKYFHLGHRLEKIVLRERETAKDS